MIESVQHPLRRINATLPLDESVRMPRASWTLHSTHLTTDRFQRLSQVRLCAHALTHIDLPDIYDDLPETCEDRPRDSRAPEGARPDSPHGSGQGEWDFRRAFTVNCIVLNLEDRLSWMRNHLAKAMARAGLQGYLPIRPVHLWSERDKDYELILEKLKLDVGEVRDLLADNDRFPLKDTCLILYTGWRVFAPLYKDCGSPLWWAWHVFLLHPYLTREAAEWLRQQGVIGIGTDAVSVDSPLRHWLMLRRYGWNAPWDSVRLAVDAVKTSGSSQNENLEVAIPVHRVFLGSGGFLLESLALNSEILSLRQETSAPSTGRNGVELPAVAEARMTVLPFSCRSARDALLACALFLPPRSRTK